MFDINEYEFEEWACIIGFYNYIISTFGRVYNTKYERFLKACLNNSGYRTVNLYQDGVKTSISIHRLVAETFLSNYLNKDWVNHIDGNKENNHVSNLEWATPSENRIHAYRTGLQSPPSMRAVRVVETNEVFESISSCARAFNLHEKSIHRYLSGMFEHRLGLHFKYVNN